MAQERFTGPTLGAYGPRVPRLDVANLCDGLPESECLNAGVAAQRFLKESKTDCIDPVVLHCVTSERCPAELSAHGGLGKAEETRRDPRPRRLRHSLGALEACIDGDQFGNSDGIRDNSVRYAINLDCVDFMVVGFERTEKIDDFGTRATRAPIAKISI